MNFIEEVLMECKEIWDGYLNQPFLMDIRKNTLSEESFVHYLKEDTKYLKDYARVFGMGIYKSKTMEEILLFYGMLKFVEANEHAVRVNMLQEKGYCISEIEQEVQHPITAKYTSFLLETAQHGEIIDMLFATLPCMLSYAYIGQQLLQEQPNIVKENKYGTWIEEYICEAYLAKCREWMAYANQLSLSCGEAQKDHLKDLFKTASLHEQCFWDMSYIGKVR